MSIALLREPSPATPHHDEVVARAPSRRSLSLRGRDAELAVIGEALASVHVGTGATIIVAGPAGCGRTRLLDEAIRMAGRNGFRIATVGATRGTSPIPLQTLLTALCTGASPLVDATELRRLGGRSSDQFWLVQELQDHLGAAASERPLLIAVDDVQWADPASQSALRTLVEPCSKVPIVWVLTVRCGVGSAVRRAVEQFGGRSARLLQPAPLEPPDTSRMAREVLQVEPSDEVQALMQRGAGNPALVEALLTGLAEQDAVSRDGHVAQERLPERVNELVRRRLDEVDDLTRKLLQAGAVLGRFSVEHAAEMLGVEPTALLEPVEQALEAGLLTASDALEMGHPLVGDAMTAMLPEAIRHSLQRKAAEVLLAAGADAATVGAHFAASATRGDAAAIVGLRHAARAMGSVDPGGAADFGLRALELLPEEDPSWAGLVAETVLQLDAAMRSAQSDALAAVVFDAELTPAAEADVRLSFATPSGRPADARAAQNRRALMLDGLPEQLRAQHLATLLMNLAIAGRTAEALPLAESAGAAGLAGDDDLAISSSRLAEALLAEATGRHDLALELVCTTRSVPRTLRQKTQNSLGQVIRARLLTDAGRIEEADRVVRVGAFRAQRDGHRWLEATWSAAASRLLLHRGQLSAAAAEAEHTQQLIAGDAQDRLGLESAVVLGYVAMYTGDSHGLKVALGVARRWHREGDPGARREAAFFLASAAAAGGQPAEAASWLEDEELAYAIPGTDLAHPPVVVRIALATKPAMAAAAIDRAACCALHAPSNPVAQAVEILVRSLRDEDADGALRAAVLLRGAQRPLVLASALEDCAVTLIANGRVGEAEQCAEEALALWHDAGAHAEGRRLRRRLRALGIDRRSALPTRGHQGWDSLTDAELSVVHLVAEGHTNRRVADRLILSPHTVSTHLRHAFAKLEINSRVELTRIVLQGEQRAHSA